MRPQEAPTDIADLIPRAPGLVAHYLPQLRYLLIEQNQYTDETLTTMRNLVAAIIQVEHPASSQALFDLIDWVSQRLQHADTALLQHWVVRFVHAQSLHDVFES